MNTAAQSRRLLPVLELKGIGIGITMLSLWLSSSFLLLLLHLPMETEHGTLGCKPVGGANLKDSVISWRCVGTLNTPI